MRDAVVYAGMACYVVVAVLVLCGPAAVQYLAATFGVVGALVLAIPGVDPAAGFAAFLVSNIGWLVFSASRKHWGLFAQQAVFLVTSLIGLWNWWLGPLVLAVSMSANSNTDQGLMNGQAATKRDATAAITARQADRADHHAASADFLATARISSSVRARSFRSCSASHARARSMFCPLNRPVSMAHRSSSTPLAVSSTHSLTCALLLKSAMFSSAASSEAAV